MVSIADYRRWETGRLEPIRHDAQYVRLINVNKKFLLFLFVEDATIGSISR